MNAKKLVELRQAAEKAVADMPDGELKVKAFEVILGHMIETPDEPRRAKPCRESPEVGGQRPRSCEYKVYCWPYLGAS
jgi:hypothetical protein